MEIISMLDKIITKEKTILGVIDFVSKKQLIFYDLNHDESTAMRVAVLSWRLEDEPNRFSVYAKMNFPDFELPVPIIIPISSILNKEDHNLIPTELKRKTKTFKT